MAYYFAKTIQGEDMESVIDRVTQALSAESFGILTQIDVRATMKQKLDMEFRDYRILGACNPPLAHQALETEDKIGTMLPCNVIVQDQGEGRYEVAAIDPAASMQAIDNPALIRIAEEVGARLKKVVDAL
ncbi:MAG: DUF302 domain-containing protein [Alphaproteobacteria bacterium]|jgi:uncharacterized protein (DUF302 family)|nr:DUF302 domain-containing protein [Alphaproteobacteria bacterium]